MDRPPQFHLKEHLLNMIKVTHTNGIPEYTPPNFGSHFDGEFFNFFESVEERESFMAALPPPEPAPIEVETYKLRIALSELGHKTAVYEEINKLDEPYKTRAFEGIEYSNTITSGSMTVELLRDKLGMTKEQMYGVFEYARAIVL